MSIENIKQDVINHWDYVESVLIAHGESADVIYKCGFHYRTAFEHGFKHGVESAEEKELTIKE